MVDLVQKPDVFLSLLYYTKILHSADVLSNSIGYCQFSILH